MCIDSTFAVAHPSGCRRHLPFTRSWVTTGLLPGPPSASQNSRGYFRRPSARGPCSSRNHVHRFDLRCRSSLRLSPAPPIYEVMGDHGSPAGTSVRLSKSTWMFPAAGGDVERFAGAHPPHYRGSPSAHKAADGHAFRSAPGTRALYSTFI